MKLTIFCHCYSKIRSSGAYSLEYHPIIPSEQLFVEAKVWPRPLSKYNTSKHPVPIFGTYNLF